MEASSSYAEYQEVYLLISIILLLPVLLWPVMLMTNITLKPSINFASYWQMASVSLLVVATTADSMLTVFANKSQSLFLFTVWILGIGLLGTWAINEPDFNIILGLLFFIHSSRSARLLWRGSSDWWLWPAWIRDILACVAVFLWPLYLA